MTNKSQLLGVVAALFIAGAQANAALAYGVSSAAIVLAECSMGK